MAPNYTKFSCWTEPWKKSLLVNLQFLEQPDLTNIPVDVETYCKEVEAGLTTEDIAALARPQALSPLHQELLYCHNHLYHMPNHRLIKLAK